MSGKHADPAADDDKAHVHGPHVERIEGNTSEEIIDGIRKAKEAKRTTVCMREEAVKLLEEERLKEEEAAKAKQAEDFRKEWERRKKHLFVFSSASRPIFTRYGDETEFLDFFGMMGLLVAISEKTFSKTAARFGFVDETNGCRFLKAGNRTYVFVSHRDVHYLIVSMTGESVRQLASQLHYVNSVLVSILTNGMFLTLEKKPNYDLRDLLGGSAASLLRAALRFVNNNPSYGLSAIPVLKIPRKTRDNVTKVLKQRLRDCGCSEDQMVHAFILYHLPEGRSPYGGRAQSNNTLLVTYLSADKEPIHPRDFSILTNFMHTSLPPAAKYQEIWAPCCLPEYSPEGYLYLYMTFITPTVSLVMSSVECSQQCFSAFSAVKDSLVVDFNITTRERLSDGIPPLEPSSGLLMDVVNPKLYSVSSVTVPGVGTPDDCVLHFMFKDTDLNQFTCSRYTPPFVGRKEQKGLLRLYLKAAEAAATCAGAKKTMIYSTEHYSVFIRLGKAYELYVAYRPMTSKQQISEWATQLKKWARVNHEVLFSPPGTLF
eukprot:TRINITY_DN6854_c0_g2_i1.p1 TRINITY_DN6854_c0_g2~~TRINITY_DN6854_c0_g2_i1.p1  ORF type:complete len:543 (+),score=179.45 TRINITY_DN6854_c0_g2_i1:257-1885(+)